MTEHRWKDEEAEGTFLHGRISIFTKPSMVADDGTVAVGIEAPWITDLEKALVDLDRAAGEALEAGASGDPKAIDSALHSLDEVRGRIWATHNRASDVLKEAERREE